MIVNVGKHTKGMTMKTVAIESLYVGTILTFCENAAELGCPQDQEVDMWFRYLSDEEQFKVGEKMIEIEERDAKMKDENFDFAEYCEKDRRGPKYTEKLD